MTAKNMMADLEKHRPKEGFNVVGVDTFEAPGEQVFVIDHCDDEDEANKVADKHKKAHEGELDADKVYVVGPAKSE